MSVVARGMGGCGVRGIAIALAVAVLLLGWQHWRYVLQLQAAAVREHTARALAVDIEQELRRSTETIGQQRATIDALKTKLLEARHSSIGPGLEALASTSDTEQSLKREVLRLKRRLYLRDVRSYRLSSNLCVEDFFPGEGYPPLPDPASEPAFRCFPKDYKERACMGGKVKYPAVCKDTDTPSDSFQLYGLGSASATTSCNSQGANCSISPRTAPDQNYPIRMPLEGENRMRTREDGVKVWTKALIDWMINEVETADVSPRDYIGAQADIMLALAALGGDGIRGKQVLVAGSIAPWLEAIMLREGALHTTTTDYNPPVSTDPRCDTVSQSQLLESGDTWPFVISYSSLEHDGQGRYGDPLDPDGDLAAMKEYWQLLQPGGKLLLSVPVDMQDNFFWVSMRSYGPHRLPLLLRGWKWIAIALKGKLFFQNESFILGGDEERSINGQPMMILEKVVAPTMKHNQALATLEDSYELTTTDNKMSLACEIDETLRTEFGVPSHCAVRDVLTVMLSTQKSK